MMEHRCGALVEVAADRLAELDVSFGWTAVGRIVEEPREMRFGEENILTDQAIAAWRDTYRRSLQ